MSRESRIGRNAEEDIRKISQAMDALAKLIIEKRQDGTQLQLEYQHKLERLNQVIELILGMRHNESETRYELDANHLDRLLRGNIEIVEKTVETLSTNSQAQAESYALIPIVKKSHASETSIHRKKKKKNKICCSFCNEPGHTRAKCEKKLLFSKE
ncbi:hypothetical protein HG535_0B01240 [Zygotorulaspora mrakii]|uniref:CCHC-type domain-containing protein n=1 Tax=Zygotorulaspora mrakii TaxID=42260 RepID=A0A7H9AXW4_ZYGMR|nr:uncharacterized protein HG535_0B01240 [Zygotorulaspora mrakii]QLG71086.1 hypothetical protein HG535_0B01240 [Zygotorulaspora mrakii]